MSFLVVDLEYGGLDGWYPSKEIAQSIADHWMLALKHSKVIVAEFRPEDGSEPYEIGKAFMADRESNGELRGILPDLHAVAPPSRERCIRKALELLIDLYNTETDRETLILVANELRHLINADA